MMKREYRNIFKHCLTSDKTDAIALVNEMMDRKDVPIHGPVHHFIVPAVLLTCYHNTVGGDKKQLAAQLKNAAKRAAIVPGGNCAACGVCGAALGFGQFASIVTENNPFSEESWSRVMEITAACSMAISQHGGPRCCKRDVYLAITTGAKEMERLLGVSLKADVPRCKYFVKNQECRKENCLFYPKKKGAAS